ncbi:MAG: type II secretion system F family protein [Clostridia bacterium]|nr:type II secretion system F family protein [Clostridia bacterium]
MKRYKYVAVDLHNQRVRGTFIAADEKELAMLLAKQGLYLVSAKSYSGSTPSTLFILGSGRVSLGELTSFCRQFSIMQNTHVPLPTCLEVLRKQGYSAYFTKTLDIVYEDVRGGMLLSEAVQKHSRVFPDFFRSMIFVGEMSGKLDSVLLSLADYYEKEYEIRRKLKSAMAYPVMLLLMTIGILALMLTLVVPTFRSAMADMDVVPSGLTLTVYNFSDFVLGYWHVILAVLIAVILAVCLISRTERGKYAIDLLAVKLPAIRSLHNDLISARFSRAFGLLLSSGMDLDRALDAVEVVLGNRYVKKKFHSAAESVRRGVSLAEAFEAYGIFPKMMTQMINIGEKSASLDEVLVRSCAFFEARFESSLNSFTSKIQPVMLIVMGLVIGVLFIAVYSPMLSIMNDLGV